MSRWNRGINGQFWEDMTTNEKLNLLRAQIQELQKAIATSKIAEFKVKAEGLRRRDTA